MIIRKQKNRFSAVVAGHLAGMIVMASIAMYPLTARANGGPDIEWEESNVNGGAEWSQDPTSQFWTTTPIAFDDDGYIYRYTRMCFEDGNNGQISCLPGLPSCDRAPDGVVVQWARAVKGDSNPLWESIGGPTCIYSEDPSGFEEQIIEATLRAFQQYPLAAGQMSIQPSPHTLAGAHTNMFVEADVQGFDMELLGQLVRIIARPSEYTFDYGDGTGYGPVRTPGGPLPESRWGEQTDTSHVYEQTGDFPVSVTTFFSGEYSVNGGPMVPIDGRAQVTSPAQLLSVWRSESRNVADDCLVNPSGFGC